MRAGGLRVNINPQAVMRDMFAYVYWDGCRFQFTQRTQRHSSSAPKAVGSVNPTTGLIGGLERGGVGGGRER